ncbi:hypothetical protein N657DRAFT_649597 [Parathielavia appendiculata]|uniref:Uncharacterized protein n=1 Tax=Parathielavia appendiculata TaxID=2587402 RepID=A0AAN6TTT0_9PEZI|nr:hypothetical protein N657DRAFT_649597 [Parathielavia appendiculata]
MPGLGSHHISLLPVVASLYTKLCCLMRGCLGQRRRLNHSQLQQNFKQASWEAEKRSGPPINSTTSNLPTIAQHGHPKPSLPLGSGVEHMQVN